MMSITQAAWVHFKDNIKGYEFNDLDITMKDMVDV
jgi:hypothetical protein